MCGHLLKQSAANRGVIQKTLDFLSIPNYVIKKGRPHGHRYGKLPGSREYFLASNLKKRCNKRHNEGIHDRFLRDPEAKAEQHARIHTQADHQSAGRRREPLDNTRCTLVSTLKPSARADLSKTTTCGSVTSTRCTRSAVLVSPADRAQHVEERATHERTVRHQTAHGTP